MQQELNSHQQDNHPVLVQMLDIMSPAQVLQLKQFVQRELISHQLAKYPALMLLLVTMLIVQVQQPKQHVQQVHTILTQLQLVLLLVLMPLQDIMFQAQDLRLKLPVQ